jgi:hypothetical protein
MPAKTIRVQTAKDSREIPAVWVGAHLAVHHPLDSKNPDGLSKLPRWWSISHVGTGYLAGPSIDAAQRDVIALAKLWDSAFASVTAAGDARNWRWRDRWADDLGRIAHGKPLVGPRDLTPLEELHSAGTARDVELAVRRAMGYQPIEEPEASQQFPAEITKRTAGHGAIRRNPDSQELEFWWLPQGANYPEPEAFSLAGWYPVPAACDVEGWCLGSVAETPCGDSVEPDHPDAWPRLLGLI